MPADTAMNQNAFSTSVPSSLPDHRSLPLPHTVRADFNSVLVVCRSLEQATVDPRPAGGHHGGRLMLHIVLEGHVVVESHERSLDVLRGEAVLVTDVSDQRIHAMARSFVLTLEASDQLLSDARFTTDEELMRTRAEANPLLSPLAAFARSLASEPPDAYTQFSRYYAERTLNDLLLGTLVVMQSSPRLSNHTNVLSHALAVIAAQFSDPRLTTQAVADEVNLSRRQLERLFRDRGMTIAGSIKHARLSHAVTLLTDPTYDALSVDAVAAYTGWSNGSSLARAMKKAGLGTPVDVRMHRHH